MGVLCGEVNVNTKHYFNMYIYVQQNAYIKENKAQQSKILSNKRVVSLTIVMATQNPFMYWCFKSIILSILKNKNKKESIMKMQDVCPEVVVDVVANADDMLSGEDHVESRC